ncbi:hypothetical protein ACFLRB_02005 [Acidobacteriota bacterium]
MKPGDFETKNITGQVLALPGFQLLYRYGENTGEYKIPPYNLNTGHRLAPQ